MNLYRLGTNELVNLPATLTHVREGEILVERIVDYPQGSSRPVKVQGAVTAGYHNARTFYPSEFGCYVAAEPALPKPVLGRGLGRIIPWGRKR